MIRAAARIVERGRCAVDGVSRIYDGQVPTTREALLDAATDLLDEGGPVAVTLREVGHRAGLSHNAPYKHFADKNALLAAVAARELTHQTWAARHTDLRPALTCLRHLGPGPPGAVQAGLRHLEHGVRRPGRGGGHGERGVPARSEGGPGGRRPAGRGPCAARGASAVGRARGSRLGALRSPRRRRKGRRRPAGPGRRPPGAPPGRRKLTQEAREPDRARYAATLERLPQTS